MWRALSSKAYLFEYGHTKGNLNKWDIIGRMEPCVEIFRMYKTLLINIERGSKRKINLHCGREKCTK